MLVIGAFITMTMKSGAIAAGIGRVTKALRGREMFLIPVLMVLFALGGTTFGMGEETLGFYPIIIVLLQFSVANGCRHPLTRNFVVTVSSVGASRLKPFWSYPASAVKLTSASEPVPLTT